MGSFSDEDGDGNENFKEVIGLLRKATTLHVWHTFWYISLPSLHDHNVKFPYATFYENKHTTATVFFFSLNLGAIHMKSCLHLTF